MNWTEYSDKILDKCKKRMIPFFVCFELTPLCNFKCNMCYIRLDPDQMMAQGKQLSTEQWIKMGESAKQSGAVWLELTGGEPTTRKDFKKLYESFARMGYLIKLRTNGYLLDQSFVDFLCGCKPYQISITLYGASNETYQKVCGVSDGYSVVTRNIISLKKAGINLRLTMTLTKENVSDVQKVKKWAADNGMRLNTYGGLITPIRSAKRSIDHLKIRYTDEECDVSNEIMPSKVKDRNKYMNPFWMCRAYGAQCSVSWDGRMTVCNGMTSIWSDPLADGFDKAYLDLYNKLNRIQRPTKCETCDIIEYCGSCPSKLLSTTGNCEQTCEEICRIAKRNYKCSLMDSNDFRETRIKKESQA